MKKNRTPARTQRALLRYTTWCPNHSTNIGGNIRIVQTSIIKPIGPYIYVQNGTSIYVQNGTRQGVIRHGRSMIQSVLCWARRSHFTLGRLMTYYKLLLMCYYYCSTSPFLSRNFGVRRTTLGPNGARFASTVKRFQSTSTSSAFIWNGIYLSTIISGQRRKVQANISPIAYEKRGYQRCVSIWFYTSNNVARTTTLTDWS